jgi:hypothetical protein
MHREMHRKIKREAKIKEIRFIEFIYAEKE